jgi:CRISPR-associated protein Csy3
VSNDRKYPIEIFVKGTLGQNNSDNTDTPGQNNPQMGEHAILPPFCDTLELTYDVMVLPFSRKPHACNNDGVNQTYIDLATAYEKAGGYRVLAELYIWNILNARFAWRNTFYSQYMSVEVTFGEKSFTCDAFAFLKDKPATFAEMVASLTIGDAEILESFIDGFAKALAEGSFRFGVHWKAGYMPCSQVFPSEQYARGEVAKGDTKKILAKIPNFVDGRYVQQASMTSQKIGAALRFIDMWHGDERFSVIPVNAYGGVPAKGVITRGTSANSLYGIRKNAQGLMDSITGAANASEITDEVHFLMANLVRGGVYGQHNVAKAQKKAAEEYGS